MKEKENLLGNASPVLKQATLTQMMASNPKPQLPAGWLPTVSDDGTVPLYFHQATHTVVNSIEKAIKFQKHMLNSRPRSVDASRELFESSDDDDANDTPTPGVPIAASKRKSSYNIGPDERTDVQSVADVLTGMSKSTQPNSVTPCRKKQKSKQKQILPSVLDEHFEFCTQPEHISVTGWYGNRFQLQPPRQQNIQASNENTIEMLDEDNTDDNEDGMI